jgi:glycosyltransferase involved in cell wall biosynthesis
MDLVADMLYERMSAMPNGLVVDKIRPAMRIRVGGPVQDDRPPHNADRFLNRFWDYPRYIRTRVADYDWFHVCDHSYAHLVRELPSARTGVYCHDIDAFRCLVDPEIEPRPRWYRAMARRILSGLRSAAIVFYSSSSVRDEIERHRLVDPARLVYAPYGVSQEYLARGRSTDEDSTASFAWRDTPFLLHVGSCIPRKRIDVLLEVFALVRARHQDLRLLHVGGAWTSNQKQQIERLGLVDAVVHVPEVRRVDLATLYRHAQLVLLPSDAEGFGLPVIEGLACGATVVASDITVLREVGGDAVVYCPVGDVELWAETVGSLLEHRSSAPELERRLARSERFSWDAHANTIREAYERLT